MSELTKIKLCGMTRKDDVDEACLLNVDALGFIFYPKSKRAIDIETAIEISKHVPKSIARYAVVVNPDAAWLKEMLSTFKPTLIQFHGEETPDFCQQFDYPYIKAIAAKSSEAIIDACEQYQQAEALLIDTPAGSLYGGTGTTFDWDLLPQQHSKPVILAGGLTVENVVDAINQVQPAMVDCCSGVELTPGIKNKQLMRQFIQRIRGE